MKEKMRAVRLFGANHTIGAVLAFLVIALGIVPGFSRASNGNIDLFSTSQAGLVDSTAGDGGVSGSVGDGTDTTILGGARDLYLELLTKRVNTLNEATLVIVPPGWLSLSFDSEVTGTASVQWDGPDGSIALNPTGLGGIDLTGGGAVTEFELETVFADSAYEFVVTAWTDATHWTSVSFSAPRAPGATGPTTLTIDFADFTTAALCNSVNSSPGVNAITCSDGAGNPGGNQVADFTQLGALELIIDPNGNTPALDLALDSITTMLPPRIDIEKATNGVDADDPNAGDAPQVQPGGPVTWTYLVTNTGNVPLQNVVVTDDQGVTVSCPETTLDVGESMICTASGIAEDLENTSLVTVVPGQCGSIPESPLYENKGKVTGETSTGGFVEDEDPSHYCNPPVLACRMTGGGVDTDLNWDHTLEDGTMVRGNGAGNLPDNIDRYQMGGQAGANTALPPQPRGEWTHHQQTGPSGSFTFHAGTASAPPGTEIDKITCTDPGYCVHARQAPAKQIDFEGVGTFKNVGNGSKAPVWGLDADNVEQVLGFTVNVDTGHGNAAKNGFNGTFHWFEVNVDDLGEPKVEDTTPIDACPTLGFGVNGDPADPLNTEPADCGCPDFYRIKIYNGVYADDSGNISPDKADLIYEAYGYPDGGNLQIHPLTGYDSQ